ncbi:hypothetical protein NQ317_018968 [Molorchus minor]|uniref:DDE-1 domain-containing protein n=1 Tax=Molorchus minor TaxID=1323400 RepID=A0ABQ9JJQ0_9CUCU|nr:hypothetical protein NQ317_018968 [Molorchus minor]
MHLPPLPKPTQLHGTSKVSMSTASPADSSIFSTGISVRENVARCTFAPSTPALIEISRQTYSELITDDPSLSKIVLPEYLDYYSTAMLWFRILTLKAKNSQALTVQEQETLELIQTSSFLLPEPILLQLRAIGNIVTSTKQHLYPEFSPLPSEVIAGFGGYYGQLVPPAAAAPVAVHGAATPPPPVVDNMLHNLYEEIPCLGVVAEAIQASIGDVPPGRYQSRVVFQAHTSPTPLGHRRNEAKNLAIENNITPQIGMKVAVKRWIKRAHRIIDTSKSSTSVIFSISGDGNLLPPYVVYKAKHIYPGYPEWGLPRFEILVRGWFDSCTFEDLFFTTALPYMRKLDGPKVIIVDNLSSHLTINVIQECEINNIRFVLLPSNSRDLLQPLDVAYFRSFERCMAF